MVLSKENMGKVTKCAQKMASIHNEIKLLRDDLKAERDTLVDQLQIKSDRQAQKAIRRAIREYIRYTKQPTTLQEKDEADVIFEKLVNPDKEAAKA